MGMGILNRVVKAEAMSVGGALLCTGRFQDNIETRRVIYAIARVMRALYKEDYTINLQLRCGLLVQRMLILVTAQHLARWWRDKMHSNRAAMLIKTQGFHRSLLDHGDGLAYYMMKYYHTGSPNFTVKFLKSIHDDTLTHFPSYIIRFTKVYFFIYLVLITSVCAGLSDDKYIQLLFGRGKTTELDVRCSSHDINISKFYTTSCLFICNGLFFMDAYELILEFGHHLGWLFGISNVFLFVTNGGSIEACELFDETMQQVHFVFTILRLHMTKENKSGNA
ncbi:hypothetical protein MKW98_000520 [Papaver atlanticum]|uniref:Uncharacterized protein n=1 Tax=Papaver atlanticum TaxID=357466 RepID=A0AAD4S472_9MAGN|nr:hypothetical protein MKW98_000520 [Papaver atlanticum]